jgi:hypothetical protein
MTRFERQVVSACADAMFPADGPIPVSGTEAGLVRYAEDYVAGLGFAKGLLVRLMFIFIQLSPLVHGPRFTVFTRLTPEERETLFRGMIASDAYFRRLVIQAKRAIMTFGYFAHRPVAERIMGDRGRQEEET